MTQEISYPPRKPGNGRYDVVDSLLHPQAMVIRQLLARSERQALDRTILIDDEENILQAIRAGVTIQSVFYAGDETVSNRLRQRLPANAPIYEVAKRTCKKLFANDRLSRIFAIATAPPPHSLASLLDRPGDIVALDDVSISGNIGAIIRTSLAMGAGGIVLLNANAVDIYDRRLIRASRGYLFALPIVTATSYTFVQFCTTHKLPMVVAMPRAKTLVHEISLFPQRLALVFGGEKKGCSQQLVDAATHQIQIPTTQDVESLNVSVAAAITLYCRSGLTIGNRSCLGPYSLSPQLARATQNSRNG